MTSIADAMIKMQTRRKKNINYGLLWSETLRATEKMSKYLEEKKKVRAFMKPHKK